MPSAIVVRNESRRRAYVSMSGVFDLASSHRGRGAAFGGALAAVFVAAFLARGLAVSAFCFAMMTSSGGSPLLPREGRSGRPDAPVRAGRSARLGQLFGVRNRQPVLAAGGRRRGQAGLGL